MQKKNVRIKDRINFEKGSNLVNPKNLVEILLKNNKKIRRGWERGFELKCNLMDEAPSRNDSMMSSVGYHFKKVKNKKNGKCNLLITSTYRKKINDKELETITWRWNGSQVYGFGVKLDRYESDLKIMEDNETYKVVELWDEEFYPSIEGKYYFTFKNYYSDGTAKNYEYVYDDKTGEIQLEEQYNSLFPLEPKAGMIQDGHRFKKWDIETCFHTEETVSYDVKFYTIRMRFKGLSSYILNQIKGYKISINDGEPFIYDSYLIDEQGELEIKLSDCQKIDITTFYNHIKMWAVTKDGSMTFIFEGYTTEEDYIIGSNGYAYDSDIGYVNQDWMSKLSSEKHISELSIPGTHRSIALYGSTEFDENWTRNQRMTITTQLKSGIRYFDIHARRTKNGFAMHHGQVYQHLELEDVLDQMCSFLKEWPDEAILMKLKEEYIADVGSESFEQIFTDYWNVYKSYFWAPTSNNPRLKEVRGKIILITDFASVRSFGIPYTNLCIQDANKVNCNVSEMYGKWKKAKEHLHSANNSNRSMIYINHLSADSSEGFGNVLKGAQPWFVASGYNSRGTGTSPEKSLDKDWGNKYLDYPKDIGGNILYKGTNLMTTECTKRLGLQHVGIIVADFPGKGLIDCVLKLNLKYSSS
ncbi:phosphatidylinositol-specific phospholipase C [Bacillus cereus group sp. BfR-BA-01349]|uniref:phosphatidylinositol-specific phospholipase C n=1 Tax=Bacillus cereus group sp. BfR-BA-01349 TaxID=2920312 RepID=UPI001F572282